MVIGYRIRLYFIHSPRIHNMKVLKKMCIKLSKDKLTELNRSLATGSIKPPKSTLITSPLNQNTIWNNIFHDY